MGHRTAELLDSPGNEVLGRYQDFGGPDWSRLIPIDRSGAAPGGAAKQQFPEA
jgi:hypothetical protein